MVVFVDLDEEVEPPELHGSRMAQASEIWSQNGSPTSSDNTQAGAAPRSPEGLEERANPNRNAVTQALGCYP